MHITDPIADLLTRIRNASTAKQMCIRDRVNTRKKHLDAESGKG